MILCCSCSGNLFNNPYPEQLAPIISELKEEKKIDANSKFNFFTTYGDSLLYSSERGRIAQIVGDVDVSIENYEDAIQDVKDNEDAAVVRASEGVSQLLAVATADDAIPYAGEEFEKTMLHIMQASNYLFKKDIFNATPEIRLAGDRQAGELKKYEQEIAEVKKKVKENKINFYSVDQKVQKQYANLNEDAGKVKNSFQNAYAFYLGGLVYELNNELNDAYLDYKNALEIFPRNTYLQRDTIRLAEKLGIKSDLSQLRSRFPNARQRAGKGTDVIVIVEDGFIPEKMELKVNVGLFAQLIPGLKKAISPGATFALPTYKNDKYKVVPYNIRNSAGKVIGKTEPVCYLFSLAVRALKERAVERIIRQVLRIFAKSSHQWLPDNMKDYAVVYNVIQYFSEHADLRGWYTLPHNVQIYRNMLPKGKIFVAGKPVEISGEGKTIIRVVGSGKANYVYSVEF